MLNANENIVSSFTSPIRTIKGRVELSKGSTLYTFTSSDNVKSITVERVGEKGKFFGFGICQKATLVLLDTNREIDGDAANIYFGIEEEYTKPYPTLYITENPTRNENTNELTIVAYDALSAATAHTVAELNLTTPYTIGDFAVACGELLGVELASTELTEFNLAFTTGANFEGTESIREALNDVAEATQTIYYLNNDNKLVFKRLDADGEPVITIGKDNYFTLTNKGEIILSDITSATELGDNIGASLNIDGGATQYVRDNPFWELREDITSLVDNALTAVGGMSINQFECSWRGNYLIEIGDKVELINKDDTSIYSFLLDDTTTYTGGFKQKTQWSFEEQAQTASNPTSLGEVVKQTYAKVDKANKQIDMVVSESAATASAVAALQLTTNEINASVERVEQKADEWIEGMGETVATLTSKVNAAITNEELTIAIQKELDNGVGKVETNTGFTFNDDGLTVSKSDSEMTTQITEDGMAVYKNNDEVLTANNEGVVAQNLRAKNYLIINENSRFEDKGNRTCCFWIGG
jgi:hypothetical protein